MDLLWLWIKQGIGHIMDIEAYDHLLYILALALPFLHKKLKPLIIHITAFTIGHSSALVIAALGNTPVTQQWVEIGILSSIIITCIANIAIPNQQTKRLTYLVTLIIGLIHGLGFGNYFRAMHGGFNSEFFISLAGFNIGVEIAQLIIVLIAYLLVQWLEKAAVVDNKRFIRTSSVILMCIASWLLYKL